MIASRIIERGAELVRAEIPGRVAARVAFVELVHSYPEELVDELWSILGDGYPRPGPYYWTIGFLQSQGNPHALVMARKVNEELKLIVRFTATERRGVAIANPNCLSKVTIDE